MGVLDKIYSATRTAPLNDPMAVKVTPRVDGKGPGLLRTIGGLLAPEAGSFWQSAMAHGLFQAKQGLVDDGRTQDVADALRRKEQVAAQRDVSGERTAGGTIWKPNPETGKLEAQTSMPTQTGETERLIALWQSLPEGDPQRDLIERAIRGYQYTEPVIELQKKSKLEQIITNNRTKRFAPKGGGRGGGRGGVRLMPSEPPPWAAGK
jgi:hypothetical protein